MNVKRDILAAAIFLATGLLFYLVRSEGSYDEARSPSQECPAAVETVLVDEGTIPELSALIEVAALKSRDG